MTSARLNIFQKTQRLWDTLHPYNAAQLVELHTPYPPEQIETAFRAALHDLGLGDFVCDGSSYFIDRRLTDMPSTFCTETAEPIDQLLTRLMNQPFDPHRSMPFRPFIQQQNARQSIGLVYQHWVADSVSIRLLMHQWLRRLTGSAAPAPVALPAGGMWHYFSPTLAGWSLVAQTFGLLSYASRMKRMRRIEVKNESHTVAVTVHTLSASLISRVRARARTAGVTVGDVFIAACAEAVAKHGANLVTPRRPGLALGTIADTRARSRSVPANVFGLFLGFTMTSFTGTEAADFDLLLKRAARQRRSDLRTHAAEASQLNMTVGYLIARWKDRKALLEFYRKRFPLAGGLSNVNLGSEWSDEMHPEPISIYHRVSPAGPLMPLVLTPTTLGDQLSLCCTYRSAVLSESQVQAIIQSFIKRLETFAGSAKSI